MKKSLSRADEDSMNVESTQQEGGGITAAYDRHIDTVYRVCYSLTGNRQDAEDAVQSVFMKLMASGKFFNDTEHEKAWLIATARNQCRDLHRKWWKRKVVDLDLHAIALPAADADQRCDLEDELRKLPPTYRLVLYLYYYEGYKLSEIAAMLEMNLNTVKSKMRNARKRLKLEIEGENGYAQ